MHPIIHTILLGLGVYTLLTLSMWGHCLLPFVTCELILSIFMVMVLTRDIYMQRMLDEAKLNLISPDNEKTYIKKPASLKKDSSNENFYTKKENHMLLRVLHVKSCEF